MPSAPQEGSSDISKSEKISDALRTAVTLPLAPIKAVRAIPDALSSVEVPTPGALAHPKESLLGSISDAQKAIKEGLIGSKSIKTEIGTLKDSYVDFYSKSISSNLKAVGQLVTLHPVKAVQEFVYGTTGNVQNIAKIITSPARFAVAGGSKAVDAAKGVAKLPYKAVKGIVNSPLKIWNTLNKGSKKLSSISDKTIPIDRPE